MNDAQEAARTAESLAPALIVSVACVALALARTLWVLRRASERLGKTLHAEEPHTFARAARLALAAAAAIALALTWRESSAAGGADATWCAVLIALSLTLAYLTPSSASQRCAEHGVRRGFDVRRFEELEEWRLSGEHLRWKLAGEWTACRLPLEHQAAVRARLTQLNPGRESRFS